MSPFIHVFAAALALAACAPVENADHLTAPADPRLRTRRQPYTSVTAGAQTFRVVDPKDWREMNRQVGPQSGAQPGANMPVGGGR